MIRIQLKFDRRERRTPLLFTRRLNGDAATIAEFKRAINDARAFETRIVIYRYSW